MSAGNTPPVKAVSASDETEEWVISSDHPPPPLRVPASLSVRARRWSRLDSIGIQNFKAIKKTGVPLGDVTILVGPNASGKSSILQAIHWASRAASYISPKNTKEMMAFDRIDYLPSSEPLRTAHRSELKSDTKTTPTTVIFNHAPMLNEDVGQRVTVRIFAARNKGGVTARIEGGGAVTPYKQRENFITAYIPGLAGLSERETVLAQPQLRRQAASGDAGSVLRNVLLNLSTKGVGEPDSAGGRERLSRLNALVGEIHPGIALAVKFDEREDYNISATYIDLGLGGASRSLETAATGILQVVQIFAYLIYFRPRIMLIDEPDAHLHPDKQERLIEALERAAQEFKTQIVLTTHSPHIVRASSSNAKLVWMHKGDVKSNDDEAIRRLLGWGGLDKDALLFVEDEDDVAIRAILRQWPELSRRLSVCRCFGIENLPKDKLLKGLLVDGQLNIHAIVHRDRDFMTEKESENWRKLYSTEGAFPWITKGSDIEAYFCEPEYLSCLFGVSIDVAEGWRQTAAQTIQKARLTFIEKRKVINRTLWPNGGSPSTDDLWNEGGQRSPCNVKGKKLLSALKQVVKDAGHDSKRLNDFTVPAEYEIASDLKAVIESAVS